MARQTEAELQRLGSENKAMLGQNMELLFRLTGWTRRFTCCPGVETTVSVHRGVLSPPLVSSEGAKSALARVVVNAFSGGHG